MQIYHFLIALCLSHFAFGKEVRHHEAHVHGSAQLNIAFDGNKGRVEFQSAAEAVLGFEHEAKSAQDKKTLATVISQFENQMNTMVKFDGPANCTWNKDKVAMVKDEEDSHEKHASQKGSVHGEHSDFIAQFQVSCSKSLMGSHVILDFTSFPRIKDLDATFLIGDLQKSVEVKKKVTTVELKP